MKKIIGIFSMFSLVILTGCAHQATTETMKENTAITEIPTVDTTTIEETAAVVEETIEENKIVTVEKKEDKQMMAEQHQAEQIQLNNPEYINFSESVLQTALSDGKEVVLFVHSSACGSCNLLDGNIKKDLSSLPSNMIVLKISYENQKDIMKQFNVDSYHTLIYLDNTGKETSRVRGTTFTVQDIIKGRS